MKKPQSPDRRAQIEAAKDKAKVEFRLGVWPDADKGDIRITREADLACLGFDAAVDWMLTDYLADSNPVDSGEVQEFVAIDDVIKRLKKINQESVRPEDFVASVRAFIHQMESK